MVKHGKVRKKLKVRKDLAVPLALDIVGRILINDTLTIIT